MTHNELLDTSFTQHGPWSPNMTEQTSSFSPQSNYDKMKSEVPKYKMITPSILADRLRVQSTC